MEPAIIFQIVFYLAKILRIGTVSGLFKKLSNMIDRILPSGTSRTIKPTRLSKAGL